MEWTVAIGVDTHKRTHSAVALDRVGTQIASCEIEATSSGYARLLSWASELGEQVGASVVTIRSSSDSSCASSRVSCRARAVSRLRTETRTRSV